MRIRAVSCEPSMFHWCRVTDHGTVASKSRMVATIERASRRGSGTGMPRNGSSVPGSASHVHTGRVNAE